MASRTGCEARRFLSAQTRQRAIELDCLQESEPAGGERGEALETIRRLGSSQRRAEIRAEIPRDRQPVHHRTTRGSGLHGRDRIRFSEQDHGRRYKSRRAMMSIQERISGPDGLERRRATTVRRSPGRGDNRPSY